VIPSDGRRTQRHERWLRDRINRNPLISGTTTPRRAL
jgi:hypothetical protein